MKTNKVKLLTAAMIIIFSSLCICSCNKNNADTNSRNYTENTVTTAVPKKEQISLKNYKFPEFLKNGNKNDVLSRSVFSSFNSADFMVSVTEQPFKDKKCEFKIMDKFYTFTNNGFTGLADSNGNKIINADTYTEILPVSENMLKFSYNKELNRKDDFAVVNSKGAVELKKDMNFDESKIKIVKSTDNSSKSENIQEKVNILCQDKKISDMNKNQEWDRAEFISGDDISTDKKYPLIIKASKDDFVYYICFDELYNYTIYEGEYARIKLKVGESVGECYVLSHDDYNELDKMIKSFGSSNYNEKPSRNTDLDYIQMTMGLNKEDQVRITVSPDGYCLTDNLTHNKTGDNKYFSVLDKESFVSLVLWADEVLQAEYN